MQINVFIKWIMLCSVIAVNKSGRKKFAKVLPSGVQEPISGRPWLTMVLLQ